MQAGSMITNINGSGNDYLDYNIGNLYAVTNYDINRLYYTQSADTLICVHPNFAPFKVVRGATNSDWTASLITDLVIPKHAFTISTTRPDNNYYTVSCRWNGNNHNELRDIYQC